MLKLSFSYVIVMIMLGGCASQKTFTAPDASAVLESDFQNTDKSMNDKRIDASQTVTDWWNTLNDKDLNFLIQESLQHNRSVLIAVQNVQKARALLNESELGYLPKTQSDISATTGKSSDYGIAGKLPNREYDLYSAGLGASWEMDFFGRISNEIKSQQAEYNISKQDLQTAYLVTASDTAQYYVMLRGVQNRIQVAQENLKNQKKTFELIKLLVDSGSGNVLDLERAKSQLASTESILPLLMAQMNVTMNRLGILTGKTPSALHEMLRIYKPLPDVPAIIAVGKPIDLLKNRPDIIRATANIEKSIARYNVTVADLYPKISLTGNVGFLSTDISDFGKPASSFLSFAPTLSWSVFDMGRINKRIDASDKDTKIAVLNFEQTVLNALEDTDNALVNFTQQEKNRQKLYDAVTSARKAQDYAQQRFDAGIDDFLSVLDAQRTVLQTENELSISETNLLLNVISIYKSLGGI